MDFSSGVIGYDVSAINFMMAQEILPQSYTAYNATTNVATMRPDGLQADVNLRTSNVNKFDDVVSPYIVLEYLIKF